MKLKLASLVACASVMLASVFGCQTAESTGAKAPGQWSQWRGPNRDGKSPDTGLLKTWPEGGPKLLWKVPLIGQGFSSVSMGGGLVFATGSKPEGNPTTQPEAKNVKKLPSDRYYVTAITLDGKVKWHRDMYECYRGYYTGTRSTPTYDDGNLYLETGFGVVICCDAQTGKTIWTCDIHKKFKGITPEGHTFGRSESVLIVGDLAIVTPGGEDAFMVALDKRTGETVWKSPKISAAAHTSPIYAVFKGVPLIINGAHMGLVCVHAKTGEIQWVKPVSLRCGRVRASTPSVAGNLVYWSLSDSEFAICMKMSASGQSVKAEEVWRTKDMAYIVGGHVVHEGYIYGSHKSGYSCIELKTGKTMWESLNAKKGSICWADGMLYLYAEKTGKASLATCSPKGLEIKGTVTVEGMQQSWAHPVVAGERLYLRYSDNLFCFDVKAK